MRVRPCAVFCVLVIGLGAGCTKRESAPSSTAVTSAASSEGAAVPGAIRSAEPAAAGAPGTRTSDERDVALSERKVEREHLVRSLAEEGIREPRVLNALQSVPRHRFVPEATRGAAYADRPLPIGWGQTISQPYIVAAMTQAAAPKSSDKCLEIGTGSGYQAAVLAELCGATYSIEYLSEVARFGGANLRSLGYAVELRTADGYRGWPEAAPFDVIVVTAAPEKVPEPLLAQLAVGGRLVVPVGAEGSIQKLELWTRVRPGEGSSAFERRVLADVRFVPFLGGEGR